MGFGIGFQRGGRLCLASSNTQSGKEHPEVIEQVDNEVR